MKIYFKKQKSNIIYYRDYKNFSNDQFRADFLNELTKGHIPISRLDVFTGTALQLLGKHAPLIYLKHLIACYMIYLLLNYTHMDLI